MNKQLKGSIGEHLAAAALVVNGYQIFFNMAFTGPIDLIAERDGKIFRVQVKTFYSREGRNNKIAEIRTSTSKGKHKSYIGMCDLLILVDCETGEVFMPPMGLQKSAINKSIVAKYLIFPIKEKNPAIASIFQKEIKRESLHK